MDDTLFHHMLQDIFDYIKEDTTNHYLVTLNLCVVQNESLYDGFSTKYVSLSVWLAIERILLLYIWYVIKMVTASSETLLYSSTGHPHLLGHQLVLCRSGMSPPFWTQGNHSGTTSEWALLLCVHPHYSTWREYFISLYTNVLDEEYHSLSQCYIVDSPFLHLSSQKGLSNLYQNIYNIYQSKKQAKKHANKIWELCYLTKVWSFTIFDP